MKRVMALALLMVLAGSVPATQAQTVPGGSSKGPKKASGPSISQQLMELRLAIEAQQQQITTLSQQLQSRDQRIQQLEQKLDQSQAAATQAQAKADSAASQTAEQEQTVATLQSDVTDLKS